MRWINDDEVLSFFHLKTLRTIIVSLDILPDIKLETRPRHEITRLVDFIQSHSAAEQVPRQRSRVDSSSL